MDVDGQGEEGDVAGDADTADPPRDPGRRLDVGLEVEAARQRQLLRPPLELKPDMNQQRRIRNRRMDKSKPACLSLSRFCFVLHLCACVVVQPGKLYLTFGKSRKRI